MNQFYLYIFFAFGVLMLLGIMAVALLIRHYNIPARAQNVEPEKTDKIYEIEQNQKKLELEFADLHEVVTKSLKRINTRAQRLNQSEDLKEAMQQYRDGEMYPENPDLFKEPSLNGRPHLVRRGR